LYYIITIINIIRMNKSRKMRLAGHIEYMGRRAMRVEFWTAKPEEKRPLGRSRGRCENNITMDLREIGWVVWTGFISLWTETSGEVLGTR
jgi:hypothetical protein